MVHVYIVNSEMYERITGEAPPPSPISARTYTQYGLPWFALYDEHRSDVAPSPVLAGVKSLGTSHGAKGTVPADAPIAVAPWQVVTLR